MKPLRCILALQFATTLALGQAAHQSDPPNQPQALTRSLYQQVIARHPIGIPRGADMTAIAPYLSTTLLHRINLAYACEGDFFRHNPDPRSKPAFEWLELGLFSGDDEQASPNTFRIQSTQFGTDGTVRVSVKLTHQEKPPYRPSSWRVAAVLTRESDQYVVDDVIYLRNGNHGADYRLSQALAWGCDGPHWIQYPKRLTSSK